MTWAPVTTVSIAGDDYTGDTVGTVTFTRGRTDVYSEPVAGYATVNLLDKDGSGIPVDLTAQLEVAVEDSTGTDIPLFTGLITDVTRQLYDPGIGSTPAAVVTITAVGPLARMARRQVFPAGRPAETDAERITAAILGGLGTAWEETGGTWADQPADRTWGGFDPIDTDLIAPSLFDLGALPAQDGGTAAYAVASQASLSAEGILYENGEGQVGWDNADSRGESVDYTVIPHTLLRADGISTITSLSDIVNRLELVYDGGVVQVDEPDSIVQFGRYDRRIDTILADLSAAESRADRFLDRHAFPLANLEDVTLRLDGLPLGDVDDLLAIDINTPVVLTGLPDTLEFTQLPGFVEGITVNLDPYRYEVTLSVSDAQLSVGAIRWSQVPGTLTWADVPATLTWQDARSI
jgi:hypothetical protein